jgi:outer membrane protein assembly factor BamB
MENGRSRKPGISHLGGQNGCLPWVSLIIPILAGWMANGTCSEPESRFYGAPRPLSDGVTTSDWPRFLGPSDNATSPENGLRHDWAAAAPRVVWEYPKGEGHTSPAVVQGKVLLFHRIGDDEVLECFESETGKRIWRNTDRVPYRDRYGSGNGPRTNPVVAGSRVYVHGITGRLRGVDLETGANVWSRDLEQEEGLVPNFFGHGSTPLVADGRLVVQAGTRAGDSVLALDPETGRDLWRVRHPWGASYSSPVPWIVGGKRCVLVFAGGESRPPTGGLLCIELESGSILGSLAHRARIAESVNVSAPVVLGGDRVLVSEAYGAGTVAARFSARTSSGGATLEKMWVDPDTGFYLMTPVVSGGWIFGFEGQTQRLAELVCLEASTGKVRWREDFGGRFQRGTLLGVGGGYLCLGETGRLGWLELTGDGARLVSETELFSAPETWALPALSRGLLYVSQNAPGSGGTQPRLICYDLRGSKAGSTK